jgi:hypothetical protein
LRKGQRSHHYRIQGEDKKGRKLASLNALGGLGLGTPSPDRVLLPEKGWKSQEATLQIFFPSGFCFVQAEKGPQHMGCLSDFGGFLGAPVLKRRPNVQDQAEGRDG